MSTSVDEMKQKIEVHLNTISADQQVYGIALQVLLANIINSGRDPTRTYITLRQQILDGVDGILPNVDDPQRAEQYRELARTRASEFLEVIGEAVGIGARANQAIK